MTVKVKGPVVILEGGPRDQWAYYERDLAEEKLATERMGRTFRYRKTDRTQPVKGTYGKVLATIWEYRG